MENSKILDGVIDYSKKENQIGCGYCAIEKICTIRNPKVNSAKLGCPHFVHWQDEGGNRNSK
jgi:hypothetical protein